MLALVPLPCRQRNLILAKLMTAELYMNGGRNNLTQKNRNEEQKREKMIETVRKGYKTLL
jgi:hypothetical protein